MIKAIFLTIFTVLSALGLTWLLNHPGSIEINWLGYQVITIVPAFLGLILLCFIALYFIKGILGFLWQIITIPSAISNFFSKRKKEKQVLDAKIAKVKQELEKNEEEKMDELGILAAGLISYLAGNPEGIKHSENHLKNRQSNFYKLLQALSDESNKADNHLILEDIVKEESGELALVAARKLLTYYLQKGNTTHALNLLERFIVDNQKVTWILERYPELLVKAGKHQKALDVVNKDDYALPKPVKEHLRSLIFYDQALQAKAKGDIASYEKKLFEAVKYGVSIEDAVLRTAEVHHAHKDLKQANKLLIQAWEQNPSRKIAISYADLNTDSKKVEDRIKILEKLFKYNSDKQPLTYLITAENYLNSNLYKEAEIAAKKYQKSGEINKELCHLMITLYDKGLSDRFEVKEWEDKLKELEAAII